MKDKFEYTKHLDVVGLLDVTDDNQFYIDVDGQPYALDDILAKITGHQIQIKSDIEII